MLIEKYVESDEQEFFHFYPIIHILGMIYIRLLRHTKMEFFCQRKQSFYVEEDVV